MKLESFEIMLIPEGSWGALGSVISEVGKEVAADAEVANAVGESFEVSMLGVKASVADSVVDFVLGFFVVFFMIGPCVDFGAAADVPISAFLRFWPVLFFCLPVVISCTEGAKKPI